MMQALAIIDSGRRAEEEQAIRDVLVGLRSADVQVTELLQSPESSRDDVPELSSPSPLHIPMPLNWLQRKRIIDTLSREISRSMPDAIIAFGQKAAMIGHAIANSLELPLIVECWQTAHLKKPPLRPSMTAAYATASEGLAAAMRDCEQHHLVAMTPYPIHIPDQSTDTDRFSPSIAILDAEQDHQNTRSILKAIADLIHHHDTLHICIELGKTSSNAIWRYAESLGLLDRISSFANASTLRQLVSDCTLMIVANSSCCTRSVVDAAMGHGRVVLRPDHPLLSSIERDVQCVMKDTHQEAWTETLRELLENTDRRTGLGSKARAHIRVKNEPNRVFSTWAQLIHEVSHELTYPLANA